jgi:hypothetical protein
MWKPISLSGSLGGGAWGHQLADGLEKRMNARVVVFDLPFKLGQLVRQFLVQGQGLPEADEGAHYGDIDLDRAMAAQDAGQHRNPLLGKDIGEILVMLTAL